MPTKHIYSSICQICPAQVPEPSSIPPTSLPHKWNTQNYGSTSPQISHQELEISALSPPESNTLQQVLGNFLYCTREVDTTMMVSLNRIALEQANSTQATDKLVTQILSYADTRSEAITRFHANLMVIHI